MSYDADSESSFIDDDVQEFYHGYISPADEWQVTRSSLFREFTGSVFTSNDKKTARLAKLNDIVAFSESKETKKVNKKNYIDERFNFLCEFIPEPIYNKIIEVMAFLKTDKKKIAKDISLNVETLATILSLWQLELHTSGNYVTEKTLDEINAFLKESSSYLAFRCKGHITSKDIERAEGRILRQLYNQTFGINKSNNLDKKFPSQVLTYYREFMKHLDLYLNQKQRKLQAKKDVLPFHVYQLIQKIELMKKILPKVAMDYFKMYIEPEDFVNLESIIDDFYKDKNAMIGELVCQSIILLENYFDKQAQLINMPQKFMTRIKKYRLEFSTEFSLLKDQVTCSYQSGNESADDDIIIVEPIQQQQDLLSSQENLVFFDKEIPTCDFEKLYLENQNDGITFNEYSIDPFDQFSNYKIKYFMEKLGIPQELFNSVPNVFKYLNNQIKAKMFLKFFSIFISISILICSLHKMYDKENLLEQCDTMELTLKIFLILYLKQSDIKEIPKIKKTKLLESIYLWISVSTLQNYLNFQRQNQSLFLIKALNFVK